MGLLDLFRHKSPPIRDPRELADFIDQQAMASLHEGIEAPQWKAYPLGLAMLGEVLDGMLRPHAGAKARALADETIDLVLGVFDRHPAPVEVGADAWGDARSELAQRLDQISNQTPRNAADIPAQYARRYGKIAVGLDQNAIIDVLRANLLKAQRDLEERIDAAMLAKALLAGGS